MAEPQELALIPVNQMFELKTNKIDVSDIMWQTKDEGLIQLKYVDDQHLRNIALMLIGMGYQTYVTTPENRANWLIVLRMEWEKRQRERTTTFKKNKK